MGLLFDRNCCVRVRTSQCIQSFICSRIIRELDASLFVSVRREEEESMHANELSMFNLNSQLVLYLECANILENPLNEFQPLRSFRITLHPWWRKHASSSPEPAVWFGISISRRIATQSQWLHTSQSSNRTVTQIPL